jgi:hypothetical protein
MSIVAGSEPFQGPEPAVVVKPVEPIVSELGVAGEFTQVGIALAPPDANTCPAVPTDPAIVTGAFKSSPVNTFLGIG